MRSSVSPLFVLCFLALLFVQHVQAGWGDQAAASSGYNNAKRFQSLDEKRAQKQAEIEEKARIVVHRAQQARLKGLTKKAEADGILAKKTQQCKNFLNLNDSGGHSWEDVFTKKEDSKKILTSKKKEAEGFLTEELEHFKNLFASKR